jgi:perosamine synthetase
MLTAISRYGARVHPTTGQVVAACRERDEFIQGPQIAAFERAFTARLGVHHAIAASYGRMAFFFILKALQLPPGSEVVVPALTSWTVPEMVRVAGARVRFADVNPATFCIDPASLEKAITDKTRAVVPTHLFGLPCDVEAVLDIARRHNLAVIEDCVQALGATYRGRPVGTFGDGAFFSFQTWKPLNCAGGGMAVVRDGAVASRVREQVDALPWPHEKRTANRLFVSRLQRLFTRPRLFAMTGLPAVWMANLTNGRRDVYGWEKIHRLTPLPEDHLERLTNVQAALGLAGLDLLDGWTAATRSHAHALNVALADVAGIRLPVELPERTHVYYEYCLSAPNRRAIVRRCLRRGVDVGMHGADVCPRLDLFAAERTATPGADLAAQAVQIPVYASLNDRQMRKVTRVVRAALTADA